MTSPYEILVLIANDENATLCANSDGVTRLLRRIDRILPASDRSLDAESALGTRTFFACELMMALCHSVSEHAYDGIVIFADAPMMAELRQVQTSAISRVLIAQVVGTPPEASDLGSSPASVWLTYRGTVQ